MLQFVNLRRALSLGSYLITKSDERCNPACEATQESLTGCAHASLDTSSVVP
jgi:hypothetical protein